MAKKEEGSRFFAVVKAVGAVFSALVSIFFFLIVVIFAMSLLLPGPEMLTGNVAVVPIMGVISTTGNDDFLESHAAPSADIIEWIRKADKDTKTKAILLEIDSPGGTPVGTEEIARAVSEAEKPVIAVIREQGTSGAFWIATAADYVFASRMSLTGSIGVIGSKLGFEGLLDDYNITYRRLVAGEYKDAGTRWKEMTAEEQALFQQKLDTVHEIFINAVAQNRKLSAEKVREYAHGFVLLGLEAKEAGFVDAIGNKDDAVKHIEQTLGITAQTYEFSQKKTFFEEIIGVSSYNIGNGIGTAFTTKAKTDSISITT